MSKEPELAICAKLPQASCAHASIGETSARMPLSYGSAKMEICGHCGAYRYDLHGWSKWRPKEQLAFDLIEDDER